MNTNLAIDHIVSKITWIIERQSCENTVCVNLNYSTEVHFALVYWFKSRTGQCNSNRVCAKVTGITNMAANRERASAFGTKEWLFSALIQIF